MRKWIVNKLFDLMHRIDWVETVRLSRASALAWDILEDMYDPEQEPEPKRGRGRPKGSKNKPKAS